MKLCNHRYPRRGEGSCMLRTDDLFPNSSRQAWESEYVFQQVGQKIRYSQFYCTEKMSEVCPYRIHTPRKREPTKNPMIPCDWCGKKHRSGTAVLICKFTRQVDDLAQMSYIDTGCARPLFDEADWEQFAKAFASRANARNFIWQRIQWRICRRDKCCQDCGAEYSGDTPIEFEVHHILPRGMGGSDHPANLKLVCQNCHKKYNEKFNGEIISRKAKERRVAKVKEIVPKSLEEFA